MATKSKSKESTNDKRSKQKSNIATGSNILPWLCIGIIVLFTYFVFSPSLQDSFTNWDDGDYVYNNPDVASNTVNVKHIFTEPGLGNYHPLTILTLAWNYQSAQLKPVGYHEENIFFHILNTILVFFFIYLLTRRNLLIAGIVALFFGIHPMHVESVTWVSERKDVLYVFFFMAGCIAYLRYRDTNKIIWYAATFLLFVLSCLSKGMAVVFPVILFLIDYLRNEKWQLKIVFDKIPFFALSVVFGIVAIHAQNLLGYIYPDRFTFLQRMAFASYGAVKYLQDLFLPVNLAVYYPYPELDASGNIPSWYYLFPFIFVALVVLVYIFFRREKPVVFGLLFYLVSIALVLQFLTVGKSIMADRYSYLSYVGLLFAVAYLVNKIWKSKNNAVAALKYPAAALLAIGAVTFMFQTYSRTQIWKDSVTLWNNQISLYPDNYYAYENIGNYYAGINENNKALEDYNTVLKMKSKDFEALCNRATVYKSLGKNDLALTDYSKAITLDTADWIPVFNRGALYSSLGQEDKALADFARSKQLNPTDARIYNSIGMSYANLHNYAEAMTNYSKAIELNPNLGASWLNRSKAEYVQGKIADAKSDANRAQQLGIDVDRKYLRALNGN